MQGVLLSVMYTCSGELIILGQEAVLMEENLELIISMETDLRHHRSDSCCRIFLLKKNNKERKEKKGGWAGCLILHVAHVAVKYKNSDINIRH